MIKAKHLSPGRDVVFQRINPITGEHEGICVNRMFSFCVQTRKEKIPLAITRAKAQELVRNGRIDKKNLVKLLNMPEVFRLPGLVIEEFDNIDIADGNHRYVLHAIVELPVMMVYHCPPVIWKQYLVSGLPKLTVDELRAAPRTLALR